MSFVLRRLIVFVLFFLLIVRPEFVFIPLGINRFFGLAGILFYYGDTTTRKRLLFESKANLKPIVILLLPVIIISICTCLFNSTTDFYFVRYAISMILGYFSAYLLAYSIFVTYGKVELNVVMKYYIGVCLLYVAIALLCFFVPSILYFLNSIQRMEYAGEVAIERTEGTRMIGIGANFFVAALINGTILIATALLYIAYKHNFVQRIVLLVCFALIGLLGMMMVRTTMFGIIIGALIIVFGSINRVKDLFKSLISIMVLLLIIMVSYNYFVGISSDSESLLSFAFEMFENRQTGGRFEAHSMYHLYDMWKVLPRTLSSWIIGDGYWTGPDGRYYKSVDPGYLRDIWYFGIIGTFFVFRYYFFSLKYIFAKKRLFYPYHKIGFWALFVFVLIVNIKGPGDLFLYIIPFYFCSYVDTTNVNKGQSKGIKINRYRYSFIPN